MEEEVEAAVEEQEEAEDGEAGTARRGCSCQTMNEELGARLLRVAAPLGAGPSRRPRPEPGAAPSPGLRRRRRLRTRQMLQPRGEAAPPALRECQNAKIHRASLLLRPTQPTRPPSPARAHQCPAAPHREGGACPCMPTCTRQAVGGAPVRSRFSPARSWGRAEPLRVSCLHLPGNAG